MSRSRLPWLCAALVATAYLLTLAALRVPQRPVQLAARAFPEEASPSTGYSLQLATIQALLVGTATTVPTATAPPRPTVTPRPSCTGDTPAGTVCYGPTLAPTLPAPTLLPTSTAMATWPGLAQATPNRPYVMGEN